MIRSPDHDRSPVTARMMEHLSGPTALLSLDFGNTLQRGDTAASGDVKRELRQRLNRHRPMSHPRGGAPWPELTRKAPAG